jgi:hypothetical protein
MAIQPRSSEKRRVYLDLACVCFQLELRWEKASGGALSALAMSVH